MSRHKWKMQNLNAVTNDSFLPSVTCHVFIFYNPYSGNRQGQQVREYAGQFVRLKRDPSFQVNMFDISDDNDRTDGIRYLSSIMEKDIERKTKFVICSAGGDGSFVWILSSLMQKGINI